MSGNGSVRVCVCGLPVCFVTRDSPQVQMSQHILGNRLLQVNTAANPPEVLDAWFWVIIQVLSSAPGLGQLFTSLSSGA